MSTGVGVSACCLSGKVHEGKPVGREDEIAGLSVYVSAPQGDSKAKSIVLITDVFGWKVPNVRLLADEYAKQGFYVYVPDFHGGDSVDIAYLTNLEPPLKTRETLSLTDKAKNAAIAPAVLGTWLPNHMEGRVRPLVDAFVNSLRTTPGTGKIGAVGFCWGGRYALLAGHGPQENEVGAKIGGVDAVFACHPSLVAVPGDFEPIIVPFSLAVGSEDTLLDQGTVGQIHDVIAKKTELPHELRIYEDQVHGFTLRGDWSSDKDKKAMDESLQQGVDWLNKYLA